MPKKTKHQLDQEILEILDRPKATSREVVERDYTNLPPGTYQATLNGYVLTLNGARGQTDSFKLSWGIRGIANYRAVVDDDGNIALHKL